MHSIPLNERLIFALDVDTAEAARDWVERLEARVKIFKVGLQLFLAAGFPIVEWIQDRGHKVMLDLKFFDIPETVGRAVHELARRKVALATVHGNEPILKAAIQARGETKILAVTVLTSFDGSDLRAMGLTGAMEDLVYLRAFKALELGCDGVVCSGREAARLREGLGDGLLVVTPGIRPGRNVEASGLDDQKRIVTAREAIANGADHLVVGRPIATAPDPVAVVEAMHQEIAAALAAS